ncbi:hypothetical protein [Actinoallomurus sp. CA-150999]|uniref:hypothetical protein n=1 Tax=Actinoallomurus sp. CA-150999 TaxID=3239887 RepID=UPI003D8EDE04
MRKLSMTLVGAIAVGGLALTSGTANASTMQTVSATSTGTVTAAGTVHTENAWPKGSKFAAYVKGKGLKVDSVTVWDKRIKNGKPTVSGWAYLEVSEPHKKFYILYATKKFKNVVSIQLKVNRKFANNTLLCAGVAPKKQYINHVGTACAKVHK